MERGRSRIMRKQIGESSNIWGKFVGTIARVWFRVFSRGVVFRWRRRRHFLAVKSCHPWGETAAPRISLIFHIFAPIFIFLQKILLFHSPSLHFLQIENNMFLFEISSSIRRRGAGASWRHVAPIGNIWRLFVSKVFHTILWKLGQIRTHNRMRQF